MKKILLFAASFLLSLGVFSQTYTDVYLVGYDTNWSFLSDYVGATDDGETYVWDFTGSPITLTGAFKFASSDWATIDIGGVAGGSTITLTDGVFSSNVEKAGGNFVLPNTYKYLTVSHINLNVNTQAIEIRGVAEEQKPTEVEVYLRGDVNNWLNSEVSAGTVDSKWIGTTTDADTYVWDFTTEPLALSGAFKIADASYSINYGMPGVMSSIIINGANAMATNGYDCAYYGTDNIVKLVFVKSAAELYLYNEGESAFYATEDTEGNITITFTASLLYGESTPENITNLSAYIYDTSAPDTKLIQNSGSMSVQYTIPANSDEMNLKARWEFELSDGSTAYLESDVYSNKENYNFYLRCEINNWLNDEIAAGTVDPKWIGATTDANTYTWDFSTDPIDFGYYFLVTNADRSLEKAYVTNYGPKAVSVTYVKSTNTIYYISEGVSVLNPVLNADGSVTINYVASEIYGETAETVESLTNLTAYIYSLDDPTTALATQAGLNEDGQMAVSYSPELMEGDELNICARWEFEAADGTVRTYTSPSVFKYTHTSSELFTMTMHLFNGETLSDVTYTASLTDDNLVWDVPESMISQVVYGIEISSPFRSLYIGEDLFLNVSANIGYAPISTAANFNTYFNFVHNDVKISKVEVDLSDPTNQNILVTGEIITARALYLRGSVTAWEALDSYAGTTTDGIIYTWGETELMGEFKFGDADYYIFNFGVLSAYSEVTLNEEGIYSVVLNDYSNLTLPSGTSLTAESITLNVKTGELTIKGSSGEINPLDYKPLLRGTFNNYLNTEIAEGTTIASKWRGVTTDEGKTYTWDFSAEPLTLDSYDRFLIADSLYAYHYYGGPNKYNNIVELGMKYTLISHGGDLYTINAVINRIVLDVENLTLTLFGTEVGVVEKAEETITVYAANGRVYVSGAEEADLAIFDLVGNNVSSANGSLKGNYIVKIGESVLKLRIP